MGRSASLVWIRGALVICLVVGLSALSVRVWRSPREGRPATAQRLSLRASTTVQEIAQLSGLARPVLRQALGLRSPSDLQRTLADLGLSPEEAQRRLQQAAALGSEEGSKDWKRILARFALWTVYLAVVFALLRRRRVTPRLRLALLGTSVLVFGVLLGPSPNPMGTVKDAIALWGRSHVIFPPRLIALGAFLLMTVLANKFICGWGCQFGALQDLLFRLGRNRDDTRGVLPQVKVPFALSNTVRVVFFAVFTLVAVDWAIDIVEPIDPFRIYSPADLTLAGAVLLGAVLAASPFIYRPWCHFLCPFGLVGWLAERISLTHVRVDYTTCIACRQCARACPSTVMGAILKQDRVTPDCFACGTCLTTCPTRSISFGPGRRDPVPVGKFEPVVPAAETEGTEGG